MEYYRHNWMFEQTTLAGLSAKGGAFDIVSNPMDGRDFAGLTKKVVSLIYRLNKR